MKINLSSKIRENFYCSTNNKPGSKMKVNYWLINTTCAYHGAEVSELVWIFILYQISRKFNKNNTDSYRDDGLAEFKIISGLQAEKIKKHFQNIFGKNNLNITVKCIHQVQSITYVQKDFFFYVGFTNTHELQDCRGRGRAFHWLFTTTSTRFTDT